ncbi:hypothetical protein [Celeribacter sp.]
MMDFLRHETYALSPTPLASTDHGFEFEAKHGGRPPRKGLKDRY